MNAIITGDCLDVMAALEPATVDAIVTDPPYALTANKKGGSGEASVNLDTPYGRSRIGTGNGGGFMGKAWDAALPGVEVWAEALRVAKPGAHLVAFGGTRTHHRLMVAIEDAGWEIRDCLMWLYGSGFPKSHNGAWGGTALKPAWEPIILARKPLVGTVAANVERYGTGGLNIDGCRIGTEPTLRECNAGTGDAKSWRTGVRASVNGSAAGRWPANVVLDEDAAARLDAEVGNLAAGNHPAKRTTSLFGTRPPMEQDATPTDSGGPSRFYYTAKASRSEREAGLTGEKAAVLIGAAGHKINPMTGLPVVDIPRSNHHPTVKPLALMRWLCRLVTPTGGLILDPFAGSGSTGCAAVLEGFRFHGIELSEDYAAIARQRLTHWASLTTAQLALEWT